MKSHACSTLAVCAALLLVTAFSFTLPAPAAASPLGRIAPSRPVLLTPASNTLNTDYGPWFDWADSTVPAGSPPFHHYQIQIATTNTFTIGTVAFDADVNESLYQPGTVLNDNTTYYWRVRAWNAGVNGIPGDGDDEFSLWSLVRSLRTAIRPPNIFSPNNGEDLVYNRPRFLWAGFPGSTGYTLQVSRNAGFTLLVGSFTLSGAATEEYTPAALLPPGVTLWWRVRANGPNGPSGWSNVFTVDTAHPPSAPLLVSPPANTLTTDYTPTLDWSDSTIPAAPPGAAAFDHYHVRVARDSAFTLSVRAFMVAGPASNSQADYPYDDLWVATTYYWQVRAYNADLEYSEWSPTRTFRTAIPQPTLVSPCLALGESVHTRRPAFTWTNVPAESGYTIQVANNETFTPLAATYTVNGADVLTYTPTADLPANIQLYWRLRANGAYGPSAWSPTKAFFTGNPPSIPLPAAPANNALVSKTPTLDWPDSTPAPGTVLGEYHTQWSEFPDFSTYDFRQHSVSQLTIPAGEMNPNTKYYWRVRSSNAGPDGIASTADDDFSAWSAVRYLRTKLDAPVIVEPDGPLNLDNKRPRFAWNNLVGATGYTLEVSLVNTFTTKAINVTLSGNANTIYLPAADLLANTTYYWRVRANGANGPSDYSLVEEFITGNPPSIPLLLAPANNTLVDNPFTLDWADSIFPAGTDLQLYDVQFDTDPAFSAPINDNTQFTDLTRSLDSGTKYYWRVRTWNSDDEYSAWPVARYFRIRMDAPVLVSPPFIGVPEQLDNKRPTFTWNPVAGATGYTLEVSLTNTFASKVINKTLTGNTNTTFSALSDLLANTTYSWRVKANGPNGPSAYSAPIRSFITGNPPSIPTLASPANNALVSTTPLLNWSDVTLPAGTTLGHYQIQIATDTNFNTIIVNEDSGVVVISEFTPAAGLLNPNTRYYWRVCAWNTGFDGIPNNEDEEHSAWSVVRYFRTAP